MYEKENIEFMEKVKLENELERKKNEENNFLFSSIK